MIVLSEETIKALSAGACKTLLALCRDADRQDKGESSTSDLSHRYRLGTRTLMRSFAILGERGLLTIRHHAQGFSFALHLPEKKTPRPNGTGRLSGANNGDTCR